MIDNFWRDLSIGQVLTVLAGLLNLLVLFYSGRAARFAKRTIGTVRHLLTVIGQPREDRTVDTSLLQEVQSIGDNFGHFIDKYKRDQDNILTQLRSLQSEQRKQHDQSPIRHSYQDPTQKGIQ